MSTDGSTGQTGKTKVAVIGSGNIGTDLMFKVLRLSESLEMAMMVGIDPDSDGLARAKRLGIDITTDGVDGLITHPRFGDIDVIFDATSASAHEYNARKLAPYDKRLVDLTPAAIGPYVVPAVNVEAHLDRQNVNMVTCGGQATIPMVAAISKVTPIHYAEIVASIASKSAGPGTRANIDEFTETTARALEVVGGARTGKAIIVLNPADPPLVMRDTVQCLIDRPDQATERGIVESINTMAARVAAYVPGYRLKQAVQFRPIARGENVRTLVSEAVETDNLCQVTVFLEVEGAAHYLPAYAGNLDIMTSAALQVAERIVADQHLERTA
ncbi:acetaldehyde dehydrogenase (acetylating) [Rhodococcus sp. SC4]|nr:acetaldehyde dehydrogenase (acetylating) [Rhodococcus sp. SC4]